MKTLVVYYSRKGYAEAAAAKAANEAQADLLCIETTDNTVGYNGFHNCVRMAVLKKDIVLFPYDEDISSYEKIIICSPVWCGTVASPMREFLKREKHNIKNAEYIFLHALPFVPKAAADDADNILCLHRSKFTAVHCVCGHIIKEEII